MTRSAASNCETEEAFTRLPPGPGDPALPRKPLLTRHRQPQDTAEGCRFRAAADLARATAMDTDHGRWRFEHSAAVWTRRADLLERLEASFQARRRGTKGTVTFSAKK